MYVAILRPRTSACSLPERPASENIHWAKPDRFFNARLKTWLAFASVCAQLHISESKHANSPAMTVFIRKRMRAVNWPGERLIFPYFRQLAQF
jgi:hypothetical protein